MFSAAVENISEADYMQLRYIAQHVFDGAMTAAVTGLPCEGS